MAVIKTLGTVSDAQILADLQELGTTTAITDYATVAGIPTLTWASAPSTKDLNDAASYFQQNNQLRNWT